MVRASRCSMAVQGRAEGLLYSGRERKQPHHSTRHSDNPVIDTVIEPHQIHQKHNNSRFLFSLLAVGNSQPKATRCQRFVSAGGPHGILPESLAKHDSDHQLTVHLERENHANEKWRTRTTRREGRKGTDRFAERWIKECMIWQVKIRYFAAFIVDQVQECPLVSCYIIARYVQVLEALKAK